MQNTPSGRPFYHERPSGVRQRLRLEEETGSRVAQRSEQGAHNSHAAGSNPAPATTTFKDIVGIAPDATGAMSSQAFISALHDEWDDVREDCAPRYEGPR